MQLQVTKQTKQIAKEIEEMKKNYPDLYEAIEEFQTSPSVEQAELIISLAFKTEEEYYNTAKTVFGTYIKSVKNETILS